MICKEAINKAQVQAVLQMVAIFWASFCVDWVRIIDHCRISHSQFYTKLISYQFSDKILLDFFLGPTLKSFTMLCYWQLALYSWYSCMQHPDTLSLLNTSILNNLHLSIESTQTSDHIIKINWYDSMFILLLVTIRVFLFK